MKKTKFDLLFEEIKNKIIKEEFESIGYDEYKRI